MIKILGILFVLFIATGANAVDPECEGERYNEAIHGAYAAGDTIRFCTPEKDVNGYLLEEGDLDRCVVTAAGQPFAVASSNAPGRYIIFDTPESVKQAAKTGSIEIVCENAAGTGPSEVASNSIFRVTVSPGSPTLLK